MTPSPDALELAGRLDDLILGLNELTREEVRKLFRALQVERDEAWLHATHMEVEGGKQQHRALMAEAALANLAAEAEGRVAAEREVLARAFLNAGPTKLKGWDRAYRFADIAIKARARALAQGETT